MNEAVGPGRPWDFLLQEGAVFCDQEPSVNGPAHFGDPVAEYRAMGTHAALVCHVGREWLRLTGSDRSRVLHALCTQDIEGQASGGACYALFTDRKGRIRADATLWCGDDAIWLELEASVAASLAPWIDMRVINEDVSIDDLSDDYALLGVVGPQGSQLLLGVTGELPPPVGAHGTCEIGSIPVALRWDGSAGTDGWTLRVPRADVAEVWSVLKGALPEGAGPAGSQAWEAARIAAGHPRYNAEFGPEEIPHEAGVVERAVSFSKGCYLGQEVIARVHYRGHVNRVLRRVSGARLPAVGSDFEIDGEVAGRMMSTAPIPGEKRWAGLAYLRRKYADTGSRLSLASGDDLLVSGLYATLKE